MKNIHERPVRNGTSAHNRPETGDRRVQKTKSSLQKALIGLAREKPYSSIAVKDILDRANVGRSTFYTHFRDKDDLLESNIHDILHSVAGERLPGTALERVVAFSLPLLTHIDEHRRAAGPTMKREGRLIMHQRMQRVLTSLISEELARIVPAGRKAPIPTNLIARHIASTFVLVLNWWVESDSRLTATDVDACFRELVLPTLNRFFAQLA